MKNSAWYRKLWLNKLSNLPIKEDADTAWSGMEQLLDQQLPIVNSPSGTPAPKPAGTTLGTYFSYVISAAAMVGITAYFTLRTPDQAKIKAVNEKNTIPSFKTDSLVAETSVADMHLMDSTGIAPLAGIPIADSNHQSPTLKNDFKFKKEPSVNTKPGNSITVNHTSKTEDSNKPTSKKIIDDKADNIAPNSQTTTSVAVQQASPLDSMKTEKQFPVDLSDNPGSTSQLERQRQNRQKRLPKAKTQIDTPPFNYSIEAGINHANDENSFYVIALGTYALSPRWLISTGLGMSTPRTFTGQYTRKSYFRPDSMPAFSFTDKRKVLAMDIPLTLTYKLSNTISINAGPVISLPLKQVGIKLGTIHQKTDTLMHTKTVNDILNNTKMNRINIGFSTGISLHFSQFDIHTRYQMLSPYSFSNEFGDNKFKYRSFQIGIGYRFK
ncbi:hypothetical protein [Pedobacter psychroterrae]|uniref:Outer membrane protein with beta-barrel domain n=1 Tax=Pedobacter psychroterrae TaxID=2530453 RepID=A0A4R0NJ32_9SPHI|nr:hypothetical protein [Pedobacter psychroterrae]TCD00229.1 hypothetical protein EZ437_16085 [Pedobacter psychroterrae]